MPDHNDWAKTISFTTTFEGAQWLPIPDAFEGQCTGFPDRIPAPGGWAVIHGRCRRHDWHYTILRRMLYVWPCEEWNRFREWADTQLFLGIVCDLRQKMWGPVAVTIARGVYWTVRSKLGEMAAQGRW